MRGAPGRPGRAHPQERDPVQDQITARLEELKRDLSIGEAQLLELERQQAILRETLLRISGAIQVLEELRGDAADAAAAAD
jgi:prefoldin subunit 5